MAMTTTAVEASTLARLFRAFAEPVRLAVLLELRAGERRVSDLVEAVGGSQSNVSGHLACLKECGLVVDRPAERRQVFYRLASDVVGDVVDSAERLLVETDLASTLCENPLMHEERSARG